MEDNQSDAGKGTTMKSTIGNQLHLSLFGESHGAAVGVVIDGLAPGIPVHPEFIQHQMDLRKPKGKISTQRQEADQVRILSGVFEGMTTGTPICLMIENQSQQSRDYAKSKDLARPSHADYTANEKYRGYQDYRGGGHFSGRLTAPLVAAGALCLDLLKSKDILIGSHLCQVAGIEDDSFSADFKQLKEEISRMNETYFAVLNPKAQQKMQEAIEQARKQGDSVGGVVESVVLHLPAGVGEPFFHSIESTLSQLLFSVGAVKGVEFGDGFALARMTGSKANDPFRMENGRVVTSTNHNGGINGGISNGMPIRIKTAIKPTPSIYQPQQTINLATYENAELKIEGRHDPCIVHRARVVLDSMIAIGLVDLLIERYGLMWFAGDPK